LESVGFVERLKAKVQKENLWFFILLLLSKQPRYGYELRDLVKEKFGFWSGNVTAYRVLYTLEKSGMVQSEARERRRYYAITKRGKDELLAAKKFLEGIVSSSAED
jgi:DNA-binding PadR family transcriptional regulator